MIKNDIICTSARPAVLSVPGFGDFVCTALSMTTALNKITQAAVNIGVGTGIADTRNTQNPAALMSRVMAGRDLESMLKCSLLDMSGAAPVVLLQGYIVHGSVIYRAGTPTSMLMRFSIMAPQCLLCGAPFSAYIPVEGGSILRRQARNSRLLTPENAAGSLTAFNPDDYNTSLEHLIKSCSLYAESGDMASRAAVCIAAIKELATFKAADKNYKFIAEDDPVLACMYSSIYLNRDADYYKTVSGEMIRHMSTVLSGAMQTRPVFDALKDLLVSGDFMLNFIPRGADHDFKMEIAPAYPGGIRDNIHLKASDVQGIEFNHSIASDINTPEVLIVNFVRRQMFSGSDDGRKKGGYTIGIACSSDRLQNRLRAYREEPNRIFKDLKLYRVKEIFAPKWLYAVPEKAGVRRCTDLPGPEPEKDPLDFDVTTLNNVADNIAETMLSYTYLQGNTANLTLSPDIRLGGGHPALLENRIGSNVTVDIPENGGLFQISGILDSVNYSYTAEKAFSHSYGITLRCVHRTDTPIRELHCPIYSRG